MGKLVTAITRDSHVRTASKRDTKANAQARARGLAQVSRTARLSRTSPEFPPLTMVLVLLSVNMFHRVNTS